jgi:5-methylthioadenosine/S-adenosylhomocysteine deaminase
MDPRVGSGPLGALEDADVLLERGTIAAVGRHLGGTGDARVIDARGEIVLPGFVDTHTHAWQSLIRGCGTDSELKGWLARCVGPLFKSSVSGADAYAGVRLSTLDEISTGVTTVADFSHAFNAGFARANLTALDDSGLRFVFAYYTPDDPAVADEVRRVKRDVIDPNTRARLQIGSHPSMSGLAGLTAARRLADELGVALHVHLAESPADGDDHQMEALTRAGALEPGLVVDHAIHLSAADLDRLAAHDVRVAHNPLSNMRLATGIMPLPEMRRRHMKVGLGLDGGTNDTSDMFNDMRAAVGLQRATSLDPAASPTPADALRMATLGGAEVLGLDAEVGSLTPGKKADVQIVDPRAVNFAPRIDWISQLVFNGQPANVDWVLVDGRALKRHGRLVAVDTGRVLRDAQAAADRVHQLLHRGRSS